MANYEMIGVKMGFDSTEVTKGTQKAKGDFDKLKTSLGPIGESMSKIGLSVITPLAAFGKLTMSVWDFAKASKDSSSEVERNLYELTTAADGLSEGITRMAGNAVGRLASIGKQIGNTLVSIGEFWGIADKGATEASEAEERYQRAAVSAHKSLLESLPVIKQIIELRDKQNAQVFARLPIEEQIEQITNRLAEAETRRIEAVRGSKAEKQAELDVMRLQAVQADALEKQAKEQAEAERKSDAIIAKARADGIAQEKKAADELRESKRLGKEEELEYFKLSAKKSGDLTNEETKRLEVLKLQLKEKSLTVQLEKAQDDYAKSGTKADQEKLLTLVKQTEEVKKQIDDKTQLKAKVEEVKSAEVELLGTLKDQTLEVKKRMSVGRVGTAYENQSDYDLSRAYQKVFMEMEDVRSKNIGKAGLPEWYKEAILGPYKVELDAIKAEMAARKEEAKIEAERAAWEKEHGVKQLSNDDKMLSINERMAKQLELLNARFNAAGLTTTKQVNT